MEYLPRNGNAFDSSVSELLNLRAVDASGAFAALKKSALLHAVVRLLVFSLPAPPPHLVCVFCVITKLLPGLQQLDSIDSTVKV